MKIIIVEKCRDNETGKKTGFRAFVFRGKGVVRFAATEKDAVRFLVEGFCDECKFIDTDCSCG